MTDEEDGERALVTLCQEVLGVPELDPAARFVDVGGFSLAAMQVAYRLQTEHGYELAPTALLRDESLAEVARTLHRGG